LGKEIAKVDMSDRRGNTHNKNLSIGNGKTSTELVKFSKLILKLRDRKEKLN